MLGINYLGVVVAAVAAFVVSSVWYIVFGKELAKVSFAFAEAMQKLQPWKMLVVIVQSLVLALVLAYFIGLIGDVDWMGAVRVGVCGSGFPLCNGWVPSCEKNTIEDGCHPCR
jgi:hypothetical protein